MTLGLGVCSSIEGKKLKLSTRKINPQPSPVIDLTSGRKVYKFKLSYDGSAEIVDSLDSDDPTVYSTSMLNIGDKIQGSSIDGWTEKAIKPNDIQVINRTSTHKGSEIEIKCRFYAHVQTEHKHHADSEDVQKRHPKVTETINPEYIKGKKTL